MSLPTSLRRAILLVAILALFLAVSVAQISDKIARVNVEQYRAGEPLPIQVELVNSAAIDRVDLAYRSFGESEYRHLDIQMQGNTASASIPPNDLAPPF